MATVSVSISALEQQQVDLNKILAALDRINNRLLALEENSEKMDRHIDFIHGVYATLRRPLNSLVGAFWTIRGQESTTLALPDAIV